VSVVNKNEFSNYARNLNKISTGAGNIRAQVSEKQDASERRITFLFIILPGIS
jgi:hypothetical protein